MNGQIDVIDVKSEILEDNGIEGDKVRAYMKEKGTYLVNLMSSPGSGKTTTLVNVIKALKDEFRIGIVEADVDSDVDARTVTEAGARAVQLHTGGSCHLDAIMAKEGLEKLDTGNLDLVIVENVGNLVCPAEFDIGANKRVVILSAPEGDDKPLKYPLMFSVADAVIINKMDTLPYFDFDMERFKKNLAEKNGRNVPVFPVSALSGEGMKAFTDWLTGEVHQTLHHS